MTQSTLVVPRILVIEDREKPRNFMVDILQKQISKDMLHKYGISGFEIKVAETAAEGEERLKEAISRPFDLVLLDLNLPETVNDTAEETEPGHRLLGYIKETQTAKGVIIVSIFDDYRNVIRTIRRGALDFVQKPFERQQVEPAVLNALARLMTKESNHILNQRVRDLVAYAEVGLAHSFKLIFNALLEGVTDAGDGIEKYVRERYGLDNEKDQYDTLILKLRAQKKALANARRDWAGLQAELARGGKTLEACYIGERLRDLKQSLLPCLVVKNVALVPPDDAEEPVMSFETDVEVVLREIVVGTLSELPDYTDDDRDREIRISFAIEDTRAKVRFEDNLDPIPEEKMTAINKGQRIIPDTKFGRVWGLSVVQHVALRGGGELELKTERGRNVITYYIPLADYA